MAFRGREERRAAAIATREAAAAAKSADRAKTEFLAVVSHELRTPVAGVMGLCRLLQDSALTNEQGQHVGMIDAASEGLLRVVDDLLDLSAIEAKSLPLTCAPFSARDCLDRVESLMRGLAIQKGLEFRVDLEHLEPSLVLGDRGRLAQVLINLIGNAIKFTERGFVSLKVSSTSEVAARQRLFFEVRDSGPGIDPAVRQRVFDAFFQGAAASTRQSGGVGLGLAISARLLDLMGSELVLESGTTQGSCFVFELSFPTTTASRVQSPPAKTSLQPASLRVLLADDERINRYVGLAFLRQSGHQVQAVADGFEALSALTSGESWDVAVLDVMMPGLTGLGVIQRLREAEQAEGRPRLPVVIMTAGSLPDGLDPSQFGAVCALSKPFSPAELDQAIFLATSSCDPQPPTEPNRSWSEKVLTRFGGDLQLLASLAEVFEDDIQRRIDSTSRLLPSGDNEKIADLAHAIRGAVGNLCAPACEESAARLEELALAGATPHELRPLVESLQAEANRLQHRLRVLLSSRSSDSTVPYSNSPTKNS